MKFIIAVTDPNKMGGDLYGSGSILRSSDLLHKYQLHTSGNAALIDPDFSFFFSHFHIHW